MNYDDLEQEIVGTLNNYFSSKLLSTGPDVLLNTVFEARQMPEDQTEMLQDYGKALVNVQYTDSSYSDTRTSGDVVQDETAFIVCYIQANKMKGAGGGYKLLDCVKKALLGYEPTDATCKMTISSYGDWRIEDGQMNPYIEFKFKTLAMQEVLSVDPGYIDSEDSVKTGANLLEVDSDLYALPDTETIIGTDNQVLPQPD